MNQSRMGLLLLPLLPVWLDGPVPAAAAAEPGRLCSALPAGLSAAAELSAAALFGLRVASKGPRGCNGLSCPWALPIGGAAGDECALLFRDAATCSFCAPVAYTQDAEQVLVLVALNTYW